MRKWWKRKIKEVEEEQLDEFYEAVGRPKPRPRKPNPGIPKRRPKLQTVYGKNYEFRSHCSHCQKEHADPSTCHPSSCECGRCKARRRGRPAPPPAAKPAPKRVIYRSVPYEDAGKYRYGDTLVVDNELYQVASVGTMGATPWGNVKFELVPNPGRKNLEGALASLVSILRETENEVDGSQVLPL